MKSLQYSSPIRLEQRSMGALGPGLTPVSGATGAPQTTKNGTPGDGGSHQCRCRGLQQPTLAARLREAAAVLGSTVDLVGRRLVPPTGVCTTIYAPRGSYTCSPHRAWCSVHVCPWRLASEANGRQCGSTPVLYEPNRRAL